MAPSEKKFWPQFSVSKLTKEREGGKYFSQPSHSNDAGIKNICMTELQKIWLFTFEFFSLSNIWKVDII